MIIQSSKADCSKCKLLQNESLVCKTNCESDISKVDILFITTYFKENDFDKSEVMSAKENNSFLTMFHKYKLHKQKYMISSLVLCKVDNVLTNEDYKVIANNCKNNIEAVIEQCQPKLIVGLGYDVAEALGIIKSNSGGITNMRGKIYDYNNHKLFMTLDTDFVDENKNYKNKYDQDFSKILEYVTGKKKEIRNTSNIKRLGTGIQYYNIPKKYYTEEYRLVDVQYLFSTSEILYVFRDVDNKKVYYKHNDDYYFYKCKDGIEERKIVNEDAVIAYSVKWKNKNEIDPDTTYEGDIRIPIKHTIDYQLKNEGDFVSSELNNWFFDIEIDMQHTKAFPSPVDAKFPINMISVSYHGNMKVYVLYNEEIEDEIKTDWENAEIKVFKSEKMMLNAFIKDLKNADPDSMSGWNVKSFDMLYIFNRLPKVKIDQKSFSKYGIFNVDAKYGRVDLAGIHVHDQLELYKNFNSLTKSSYKLNNIAQAEIGIKKIKMPYSIGEMYYKDINGLIKYNIRDTELLVKLEEKLGHINLANEIKTICASTLSGVQSTFGRVDPLVIYFMKKQKMVVKNANYHNKKEKLVGAFVKQPVPGIYETITDFDFTSLYPSIMRTYNIGVKTFVMQFVDSSLGYEMVYDQDSLPDEIDMIIDPMYKNEQVKIKKEELIDRFNNDKLICTINGCFYKNHSNQISELSEIVDYLMSSRKVYKKKMLEAKENKEKLVTNFFNTKQLVYKVIANSLYGVVANHIFRFYNNSSAGAITLSGQEAIKNMIIYANNKMESMCKNKELIEPKPFSKVGLNADDVSSHPTSYIITSDTDSIFCCFEEFDDNKNLENVRKWCNEIQDYLNDDVIVKLTGRHNVLPEYNMLNLKNELICAKGLFLSKKHYVIRVIEQEGKSVNDTMHVGIETKRSDYPNKTKEFLTELIDLMVADENITIKQLFDFVGIQEMEFDKLLRERSVSLAKSISFGKKLSEYKAIPQNITAMQNWNDLVYDHFRYGDRGYLFKIKGINEGIAPEDIVENYHKNFLKNGRKLEVIALPEEETTLPNYFIVDYNAMKKFVFVDRYKNIMDPLIEVDNENKLGLLTI